MCTVTLNINEAEVRELNPSLTDMASINRWAQRVMDDFIASRRRSKEQLKPYTMEELHARIAESERQIAAGQCKPIEEVFRRWDMELSHSKEEPLKPYTMEELNARIDKAERDSAEGRYRTHDEVFANYRKEIYEAV